MTTMFSDWWDKGKQWGRKQGLLDYDPSKRIDTDYPMGFLKPNKMYDDYFDGGSFGQDFMLPSMRPPEGNVQQEDITRNINAARESDLGKDLNQAGNVFNELSKIGSGEDTQIPIFTGKEDRASQSVPRSVGYRPTGTEGIRKNMLVADEAEKETHDRIAFFLKNSLSGIRGSGLAGQSLFGGTRYG
tara:strand:+ start:3998 stop:4558 length:561 start_codon:yes stop_codon:yes gene_type:complete